MFELLSLVVFVSEEFVGDTAGEKALALRLLNRRLLLPPAFKLHGLGHELHHLSFLDDRPPCHVGISQILGGLVCHLLLLWCVPDLSWRHI